MDKYNIITVLNEDYMSFGILFISSFFDNVNLDNINKIYIFDTGLMPKSIEYLNLFPKVNFVATNKKQNLLKCMIKIGKKTFIQKQNIYWQRLKKIIYQQL